jgi:NitT/TauT family transport system substrate-binding protein
MIRTNSLLRRAFVLAVLALPLAPAAALAQTKLVVQAAFPVPSVSLLPIYIADQAGFFKDEGLEVEIRFSTGGPQATQIVASGGADLALVTIEPAIQGYEKGIRGKAFYRYYTRLPFFVAVPADSEMKSAADLAGKKLGVSNMASSTIVITKSTMQKAGVPITDDAFLPVGVGDSALAALRSGQIQALSLWDSAYASMLRTGVKFRYILHPTMADFGSGMFFASDATLAAKSAALARFARAVAKGTVLYEENPAAALALYWKANPAAKAGGGEDQARATGLAELAFMIDTFTLAKKPDKRYGLQEMAKLQEYIDMYKAEGLIAAPVKAADLATDALVAQANDFDLEKVRALARGWK